MFVSGVSSMYIYIMHYLNLFLSSSIKNLTLASLSLLFTLTPDAISPKPVDGFEKLKLRLKAEKILHNLYRIDF